MTVIAEPVPGAGQRAINADSWPRVCARISLGALRHNAGVARHLAGGAALCAVVKADAYGHGMDIVVPALAPLVDAFAVATLEEGATVRGLAPGRDVIVLSELNHPAQVAHCNAFRLQPVIHHEMQREWLRDAGGARAGCWLKVDTGMHRLGVDASLAESMLGALARDRQQVLGLISHFAAADERDHSLNTEQLAAFQALVKRHGLRASMANSAALAAIPDSRFDLVRPGLLLYGVSPFAGTVPALPELRPVMHLESRVIACKTTSAGGTVGYGATWSSDKPRAIAIVAAGYADGYPRCIGNRGYALVGGRQAPVVGRVSMDSLALDVSAAGPVQVGDPVELWGENLGIATVAGWADTIPYELMCRVSLRVPRVAAD